MIVMKFGGASLASPASIRRVVSIIRSEAGLHPVVVASAMGDTTDILMEILSASRKGSSESAWKLQEALKIQHFAVCEELICGREQSLIDAYLRDTFRNLHVKMRELSDGELPFTAELQDWTISLGEQLSSRLLAAVLEEHCGNTIHLDARKLILTNGAFTNAEPRYWETYARIRWSVPIAARDKLVVLGGFIGSTEDGRTTTFGRGGSDLTASIVGAAVNADEIQVWKDVDGMLTCDPRLLAGGHQVKRLSYQEASELANGGATILHPDTMAPAKRLRIPIVIRNTFCPNGEGTRIEGSTAHSETLVKSVAVKTNITLLEVHSANSRDGLQDLVSFCAEHSSAASVVCSSERAVYIALDENAKIPEESLGPKRCSEVRIRSGQAILTLVGHFLDRDVVIKKLTNALGGISAYIMPPEKSSCSVRLAVPKNQLSKCLHLIHRAFFTSPDPKFFIAESAKPTKLNTTSKKHSPERTKEPSTFGLKANLLQPN